MTTTEETTAETTAASATTSTPDQLSTRLSRYESERIAEEAALRKGLSQLIGLLPDYRAILEKEGSRLKNIILISPDGVGISITVDGSAYAYIKIDPYTL
jgi:hypothetical protein